MTKGLQFARILLYSPRYKKSIFLLTLSHLMFFFSSCVSWQTGERLRAQHAVYIGLDINNPADGKIYHHPMRGVQLPKYAYVLAPEKTYQKHIPLVKEVSGLKRQRREEAFNLRSTGRVVPVMLRRDNMGNYEFERCLSALPKGLIADDVSISPLLVSAREKDRQTGRKQYLLPDEHGSISKAQVSQPEKDQVILMAVCDYVVDPTLNIISNPIVWGYHIITLPIAIIDTLFVEK